VAHIVPLLHIEQQYSIVEMDKPRGPKLSPDQIIWGAAEMFVRRHGAAAGALIEQRIEALRAEGDQTAIVLYTAIAQRIREMKKSTASH
jgi:hypothetical protein